MEIRRITEAERDAARKLIAEVFMRFEAPDYSKEGVEAFFRTALDNKEFMDGLALYGAFEKDALLGVLATRSNGGHIALFFVDAEHQGHGVGKQLLWRALADCPSDTLTVNSSPFAVKIYRRLGFVDTAAEQTENGIRYTPMRYRNPSEICIRMANVRDAAALLKIYSYYVEHTAVSFEYETPSEAEFAARMENILKRFPYLVAEADGELVGYAYADAFKTRAAYERAVETTIYVERGRHKAGIGRRLYETLEAALKRQNVLNLNAAVAYCEREDEYLTQDSGKFHARMGYTQAGRFHKCGYKFGRWYDLLWFEKLIGEHTGEPAPLLPAGSL